ncbi:hypothetical protein SAMN04488057_102485 [Cyclobacterium lianum]|uniref:Uncharacterized protein n=1 Tax=Cyclobacterium lianum TaxID=388280 RepID=A0A1M7KIF8_9BACT|nr:hypothetical protein [Cyclobacterium lianum]SHM65126.1 hypothetical protein SAMN04488057_102485 [Cyclobacterium lianum]
MELKKIDTIWHFFATQNQVFLKKEVSQDVHYIFKKNDIQLSHFFNPKFVGQSSLCMAPVAFEMAVQSYAAGQKKFGFPAPPVKVHKKLFFPRDLLKLTANYNLYVEKDRFNHFRVTLDGFIPRNIRQTYQPINFISQTLWGFRYFSETIKN